jgi:hypothetical protein
MSSAHFDLAAAARQEMIREGFQPDFPSGTDEQIEAFCGPQLTTTRLEISTRSNSPSVLLSELECW